MAWTATFQQIDKEQSTAVILFTDGAKYKFLDTIDLKPHTSKSFRDEVTARRLKYENRYTFIDGVNPGTFDLTPDVSVPPTQAELDRLQYQAEYGKLLNMKRRIDVGIGSLTDKDYTDQQTLVKAKFKAEYD